MVKGAVLPYSSTHIIFLLWFILETFLRIGILFAQNNPQSLLNPTELSQQTTYTKLKKAFKNPDEVYRLDLSGKTFKEETVLLTLPNFINLQELKLSSCKISKLSSRWSQLQNLEYLDISENDLRKFPEVLGKLAHLKTLNLAGNPIDSLTGIGKARGLESLDIRGLSLDSLPMEVKGLSRLKDLKIEEQKLQTWQNQVKASKVYTSLEEALSAHPDSVFHLQLHNLKELPPEIGQFTNLKTLNLNNNYLKTLPPEIGELQNLEELSLMNNQLTSLPPEISNLKNLKDLNVSRNALQALPPEIQGLQELKSFNVQDNALAALPPEIGQLKSLKSLTISENSLNGLPDELR